MASIMAGKVVMVYGGEKNKRSMTTAAEGMTWKPKSTR